jgi:integrase
MMFLIPHTPYEYLRILISKVFAHSPNGKPFNSQNYTIVTSGGSRAAMEKQSTVGSVPSSREIELAPRRSKNEAAVSDMRELTRRYENGEVSDADFGVLSEAIRAKHAGFKAARAPEKKRPPRPYHSKGGPRKEPNRPKRLKVFPATRETLLKVGRSITDAQDRALFFTLYLSGARISEVLGQEDRPDKQGCPPLIKSDFDFKPGVELGFALQTLKRRDRHPRFPTAPDLAPYSSMIVEVLKWLETKQDDDVVFNMQRTAFNKRLRNYTVMAKPLGKSESTVVKKLNPHYLRHCRLTHLSIYHHWTDSQIRTFAGWTTSALAAQYVELDKERQTLAQSNEHYVEGK